MKTKPTARAKQILWDPFDTSRDKPLWILPLNQQGHTELIHLSRKEAVALASLNERGYREHEVLVCEKTLARLREAPSR